MMASSARDPYWLARVRQEVAAAGGSGAKGAAAVEDKCLRCHAAAGQYAFRSGSGTMRLTDLTDLSREGVTCTVCHRIGPEGLGKPGSFTGGFRIATDAVLYGPHQQPFSMPMLHHTGFQPTASAHVLDSALCGSCHTLLLNDSSGRPAFAEQATYPEWLASSWPASGTTCQSCHVPTLRDPAGALASEYIAQRPPGGAFPPTRPRSPFGQHTFIGANVQMLETLADSSPGGGFAERALATRKFLAGALALEVSPRLRNSSLEIDVKVRNLTGHKLPTGLPLRRLWLHVVVSDARGGSVFESGAWDPATGELRSESPFQPHLRTITRSDQTMIYEAVMENAKGELTELFTQAARYRKDNRILPAGFRSNSGGVPEAWIAPAGIGEDADFIAGSDSVRYRVPVTGSGTPYRISVEACYQSIRPAEAQGLTPHRGPVVIGSARAVAP